jgi:hypothetical protein
MTEPASRDAGHLTGRCLCGAVGYALDPTGGVADFCHCGACRRAGGAAAVAWIQVPPAQFRLTRGTPARHHSSARSARHFCAACGSQLFMTDPEGRSVGVTLGTLDDPEAVRPAAHGWDARRPSWLMLCDGLPRYPGEAPYDESAARFSPATTAAGSGRAGRGSPPRSRPRGRGG